MSEKTLKFHNSRVNKREFHKSKQPIYLGLVNVDQIVVSDIFKCSDDGLNILLVKVHRKSVYKKPTVKRCLLILDLFRS